MEARWTPREDEALLRELLVRGLGPTVMSGPIAQVVQGFRGFGGLLPWSIGRRTSGQCRRRFLALRSDFYQSLDAWAGLPPPAHRTSRFSLLLRLWLQAGRPAWIPTNPNGKVRW